MLEHELVLQQILDRLAVLEAIDRRLESLETELIREQQAKQDASGSVELSLAMAQDDPLAAIQARNRRFKIEGRCPGTGVR